MTIPNAGLSIADGAMQNHFRRIFLLATVVCLTAATEVRAEVTLEQLRQMAIEWRQSFKSVRVTSEWKSLPDSESLLIDLPTPAEREAAPVWMKLDWTWSEQRFEKLELIHYSSKNDRLAANGTTSVADTHTSSAETNTNAAAERSPSGDFVVPWRRDLEVYNGPGNFFFSAQFSLSEDSREVLDQLRVVGVFDGVPPAQSSAELIPGIFEPHSRLWLSDQLSPFQPTNIPIRPPGSSTEYSTQRYWKYAGMETLMGSVCARLVHTDEPIDPDSHSTATHTLWLDVEHNGLPRRILTEYVLEDETRTGIDYVVDEFQQLEGGIWFPRVARRQLPSKETTLYVFTGVELNVGLNEIDFQPPQPQTQTRVTDTLGLTHATGTHDTTDVADTVERRATDGSYVEIPDDRRESGSDASNPERGKNPGIVVGLLCGLLLIGLVLWRRKSGRV